MAITLKISDLTSHPSHSQHVLTADWCAERMDGVYTAIEPQMPVTVSAVRNADVVEVTVEEHGNFGFSCSRCAEPAQWPLHTSFQHHFVGPGQLDAGEDPDSLENIDDPDVSEHDGAEVQIEDLCIEHAILSLPDFPLCDEACKGLCAQCGTNLNSSTCQCGTLTLSTGPWAALQRLKVQA